MTLKLATQLSMTAISLAILLPASAQTGTAQTGQDMPAVSNSDVQHMMPAQAILNQTLDTAKAAPGTEFRVKLAGAVHLSNGQVLPNGTELVGQVVSDETITNGTPKLALRFTQAVLKNGQVVPVKATIVGISQPGDLDATVNANKAVPASWNDGTLQVDQISKETGLELHSRAASNNSGVILSAKKKDVKLASGVEMALAISAQTPDQPVNTTAVGARR
jgi:hypothetical protein